MKPSIAVMLVALWGCGAPVSDASSSAMAPEERAPNIVVIMADDLDEATLRDAENRGWLPHIAELRARGTTFDNSFVPLSLCCPSRASFLTGLYPHNTGVLSNAPPHGGVSAFDDSSTVATWLEDAGYFTGHVGKYLNKYGSDGARGKGPLNARYVPPGWSRWQATIDPSTYSFYDYAINDHGTVVRYGDEPADYQTDVLAKRAVAFVNEAPADAPLFLVTTPLATHLEAAEAERDERAYVRPAPRHAWVLEDRTLDIPRGPAFNEEDVSDKANVIQKTPRLRAGDIDYLLAQYRGRIGSLLAVDDLVGDIEAALADTGRLSNTIFVFTSDNGWLYGEHRAVQKRFPYEESIRVPLIVRDYRTDSMPRHVDALVLNSDLAPTLAAWAGLAPPHVDGRSLISLLQGTAADWRKRFLVRGPVDSKVNFLGVRTSSKSIYLQYQERCGNNCEELYLLDEDPYQLRSQHQNGRDNVRELRRWLELLATCGGGSCQRYESR